MCVQQSPLFAIGEALKSGLTANHQSDSCKGYRSAINYWHPTCVKRCWVGTRLQPLVHRIVRVSKNWPDWYALRQISRGTNTLLVRTRGNASLIPGAISSQYWVDTRYPPNIGVRVVIKFQLLAVNLILLLNLSVRNPPYFQTPH
jgi:hypothetical protein